MPSGTEHIQVSRDPLAMLLQCQVTAAALTLLVWAAHCTASSIQNSKVELYSEGEVDERQIGSKCVCGQGSKKRIVGGEVAKMNSYPWMVAVFWSSDKLFCGGAILNNRYILSASHCYAGVEPSMLYVVVGDYDRNTKNEVTEERFGIERIIMHEQYGVKSRVDSDIALLRTSRAIGFRDNIKPICLPPPNTNYLGQTAIAAGWGTTSFGGTESMILREVEVRFMDDGICKANFTKNYNSDTMMCAGYLEGGKDACQGDSGGPLFLEDDTSTYEVAGVISFGRGCATKGYPGVYTRITNFLPWIAEKTKDAVQCSRPDTKPPPVASCGVANFRKKRVVGGTETTPNKYPWTAVIIQQTSTNQFRLRCGATLIADRWIITTARCLSGIASSSLSVVLGEHDITRYESKEVQRFISSVVIHPSFVSSHTITHDIALVKFTSPVTFTSLISPICLPPLGWSSLTMADIDGVATGWGWIDDRGTSPNIEREVFLKIVLNVRCSEFYGPVITNNIICAGTLAGENICNNDFGGQLSVYTATEQYMLVGVSSFIYGARGCTFNAPAGFMRVTFYLDWISKTTGIELRE